MVVLREKEEKRTIVRSRENLNKEGINSFPYEEPVVSVEKADDVSQEPDSPLVNDVS